MSGGGSDSFDKYINNDTTYSDIKIDGGEEGQLPITIGKVSLQGARDNNEDYHNSGANEYYVWSIMCDGHGGTQGSNVLGKTLNAAIEQKTSEFNGKASPKNMSDLLEECYQKALVDFDTTWFEERNGTTLTAVLFQRLTNICAQIQVGDSELTIADLDTEEVIEGEVLYYKDNGNSGIKRTGNMLCETRIHEYNDTFEVNRYKSALGESNVTISKRLDAQKEEDRYLATLTTLSGIHNVPEPSRTIEKQEYSPEIDKLLKQSEHIVWQLPKDKSIAIITYCDGFASKHAVETPSKVVRLLCNPYEYITSEELPDIFSRMLRSKIQQEDNNISLLESLSNSTSTFLPDDQWKGAYKHSSKSLLKLLERKPKLKEQPTKALEAGAHTAVSFLSDDNVSAEVIVIRNDIDEGENGSLLTT